MEVQRIILLIEDNEQDELLTVRALKKHNIRNEVVVCRDGAQALNWLFRQEEHAQRPAHQVPQVILLDLKLPKVDGHEVLKKIRANPKTQQLPIVVLTTSDEDRDITESYKLGANSYVRKPVDFLQFTEAVKNLGLYWLILNEPPVYTGE